MVYASVRKEDDVVSRRREGVRLPDRRGGSETGGGDAEQEADGRRDWTRTNDPHHVKVVL